MRLPVARPPFLTVLLALLLPAWLAACTRPVPVDPLYKAERGPHRVQVDDSVTLTLGPDRQPAGIRVVYPEGPGPFPVIIFSHGMFTSNRQYMPILEHWASHGYVVVAPNHLDANRGFRARKDADVERLVVMRAADLTGVMDALPALEDRIPALKGRLKPPPYAAAGHSMGTYTAMLQAGLAVRNPQTGAVTRHPERRIGAVVMSSDPGKMALMPADLWRGIDVPTFVTTGTEDYGTAGKGRRSSPYTSEVLSGAAGPAPAPGSARVDRYQVLLRNGDHYYGGLVHRDPGNVEPDPEGLRIFCALSTAFLDAYLKNSAAARRYLRTVDLSRVTAGRARLDREP